MFKNPLTILGVFGDFYQYCNMLKRGYCRKTDNLPKPWVRKFVTYYNV